MFLKYFRTGMKYKLQFPKSKVVHEDRSLNEGPIIYYETPENTLSAGANFCNSY